MASIFYAHRLPAPPSPTDDDHVRAVTRHKPVDTLRGYVRTARLFNDHAGVRISLGARRTLIAISLRLDRLSHYLGQRYFVGGLRIGQRG